MSTPVPTPPSPRPQNPLWALLVLVFLTPLIGTALRQTRMVNDIEAWLPAQDAGAQVLNWTREHFDPDSRFLLTWDSSSLADPRVTALAERLRPPTPGADDLRAEPLSAVQRVVLPHDILSDMIEHGVSAEEAIKRLSGVLVGIGPMKVRLTDAGRARQPELERRLVDYAASTLDLSLTIVPPVSTGADAAPPAGPAVATEANDAVAPPSGADDDADEQAFRPSDWSVPAHDFQVVGEGLRAHSTAADQLREYLLEQRQEDAPLVEDVFYAAGAPVALAVTLSDQRDDELRTTLEEVRRTAEEVGISRAELRMGGSPVGRVELSRGSEYAVWNPTYPWWQFYKRSPLALSAIVGTLLAFVLLRSLRLAVLVLVAAVYTSVAAVALVPATGQTLNTVLVVMPNLLLVITMSGAIHVANYWRHAACASVPDPIGTAVRMAFEPCILASVTTAIGLASLLTSVLLPVRQFGLYSAIGCLFSLAMVLWAFPALLRLWPGQPAALAPQHEDIWYRMGLWLARHGRIVSLLCLALFITSAIGLRYFRTETKVIRYFPDSARIVKDYQFLEDELAGIVGVDVIIRFPPERSASADDEDEESPSRVKAAAPTTQLDLFQRMELVRDIQRRLEQVPGVSGTLSLADFRRPAEPRPEPVTLQYLNSLRIAKKLIFQTREQSTREFVTLARSPLSVEQDGLPFRIELGEEVWRIRAQCSMLTDRQYDDFLHEIDAAVRTDLRSKPGIEHALTGMVPLFLRTQEAVLKSLIDSFGLAFITIAGVMIYLLRGLLAGMLTMLPNVLPVGIVFGAISWCGIPVDVGTMVTASVALGIAIDGTLHLLTWFRDGIAHGLSREESIARALAHCGPALWQTSTAISLGLLMLAFADLLLISRFGWLMAALIMTALLGDLVYLPALLSGVLGRVIERKTRRLPGPGDAHHNSPDRPVAQTVPPHNA